MTLPFYITILFFSIPLMWGFILFCCYILYFLLRISRLAWGKAYILFLIVVFGYMGYDTAFGLAVITAQMPLVLPALGFFVPVLGIPSTMRTLLGLKRGKPLKDIFSYEFTFDPLDRKIIR